jgi:hypothetical protein
MPDKRHHRGPHPQDADVFAPPHHATLRSAVSDLSWLLSGGYAWKSALKLVGDRYNLTERQRRAVWRASCSDDALHRRRDHCRTLESLVGERIAIDGYNLLITVESALAGGVILQGRDGCYRDLASLHGTYRKVDETLPAITLIGCYCKALGVCRADWYLDSPVSNSGRLREFLLDTASQHGWEWTATLAPNPDQPLAASALPVASSDSWVLDNGRAWVNLARGLIESQIPDANVIPMA